MTIKKHRCMGEGKTQLGDAFDCPKCWAALEASIDLSRPGAPEPYEAEPLPHLIIDDDPKTISLAETSPEVLPDDQCPSACSCSSCDPRTCAYCGRQDRACTFCKDRPPVNPEDNPADDPQDGHA